MANAATAPGASTGGGSLLLTLMKARTFIALIAVMSNGKLTGMFDRAEASEAAIVAASAKGHGPAAAGSNQDG